MTKILKKTTAGDFFINDMGITIPGEDQLTIDPSLYVLLQRSSDVITALSDGDLVFNDGTNDISDLAEAINLIQGGTPLVDVKHTPPFAAKKIEGVPLFNRTHGQSFPVTATTQDLKFVVPFAEMKFNGIEILNASLGDSVNLFILDSTTGDYTTVPNYVLNQFGYTVFIKPDFYEKKSDYDADLFIGMQIVIEYTSVNAKTIYVDYDIHELKP